MNRKGPKKNRKYKYVIPSQKRKVEIVVDELSNSTEVKEICAYTKGKLSLKELEESIGHILDSIILGNELLIKEKEKKKIFNIIKVERNTRKKEQIKEEAAQEIPDILFTLKEMNKLLNEKLGQFHGLLKSMSP